MKCRLLLPAVLCAALWPAACSHVRTNDSSNAALRSFLRDVETHDAIVSFREESPSHYRLSGRMAKRGTSVYSRKKSVLISRDQLNPSLYAKLAKLGHHYPAAGDGVFLADPALARSILNELTSGDLSPSPGN